MAFQKGDKNINRAGRPNAKSLVNPKSLTGTEYREKEFKQILRRLKPLNGKALRKLDEMTVHIGENVMSVGASESITPALKTPNLKIVRAHV